MSKELNGRRVAIMSADGFEQSELIEPRKALIAAGALVKIVSPKLGKIRGWNEKDWGDSIAVDVKLSEADADDFDAIMLPGGVMNPDILRGDEDALAFLQDFVNAGKPIAAICHGPQTLIEVGAVKGRKMTSYASIKTDLINAGAMWVDEEVVVDQGLVTSRSPKDIPAFNKKMLEEFAEGVHAKAPAKSSKSKTSTNSNSQQLHS
ncbi:MAG: type 1 glutamine amidotransferase [Oligoflexus sp.]|nr:type 1 glutamine amidotransferase [Oligoflexus sp.]